MSTHNICFYVELKENYPRIIIKYSSLTNPLSVHNFFCFAKIHFEKRQKKKHNNLLLQIILRFGILHCQIHSLVWGEGGQWVPDQTGWIQSLVGAFDIHTCLLRQSLYD